MKAAMSDIVLEMLKTPEGRKELREKVLCNVTRNGQAPVVEFKGRRYRIRTSGDVLRD